MNKLIEDLEERGCQVFIERQNEFRIESPRTGADIHGRNDLIAVFPDGRMVIYDAKTGQESASHIAQVQFYMYLLPIAQSGVWRGTKFEGALGVRGRQREAHPRRQR